MTQELINEWYNLQYNLKKMKAKEMYLRKLIVADINISGTENSKILNVGDLELKATKKITYSIDKDKLSCEFDAMMTIEKDAIKWTPSIIISKYNKLSPNCILKQRIVTIKPGAPTLSVVSTTET